MEAEVKSVGIVGYGAYLPWRRIKTNLIAAAWEFEGKKIETGLGVKEKTVAGKDEDAVTMAAEASLIALARAGKAPKKIGALFLGSESHPYAVNPSTTKVAEILGMGPDYFTADLEFACKAGTAAMQIVTAFLLAGQIEYGLAIGADTAQARPGDALEYATAAGAAAFLLGRKEKEFLAKINHFCSFNSDTPDFWRRSGAKYPSHGGRFTGEKAYFRHTLAAAKKLFQQTRTKASDYDDAVFHMPNAKFPLQVGRELGFKPKQLTTGMLVKEIGNTYSASSLLGLSAVLDKAKPRQKILFVSYGSGAGSDAFSLTTTPLLKKKQKQGKNLKSYLRQKKEIDYVEYLQLMEAIG
jgi:hydroxymethylglutaryl-CoA synthase